MLTPDIMTALVVAGGGFVAGKYLIKADTAKEDRRRNAARVAGEMRAKGLSKIPEFLESYAVGDYSDMAGKLKNLAVLAAEGDGLEKELEKAFENMLTAKLADPDAKAKLLAKINPA